MGGEPLQQLFRELHFDQRAPIELNERAGTLWPANWGRITTLTVSYGHGIAVTPLHLASAYAELVNGGLWRPATLRKLKAEEVPRSEEHTSELQSLMRISYAVFCLKKNITKHEYTIVQPLHNVTTHLL